MRMPPGRIDLMLVFDGSTDYVSSYGAFDAGKNAAVELVQRMGVGDRVGVVQLPSTLVLGLREITADSTSRLAVITAIRGLTPGGTSGIGADCRRLSRN
ncbi:MAG: hypothetical protein IPI01_10355 [Ignavibacteriae bacterium]|nr:hypothetical protein [Ignavibacteriota bacterium]